MIDYLPILHRSQFLVETVKYTGTGTGQIMDTAIKLHDRQVWRAQRWRYLVPIVDAAIALIVKIIKDFI